MIRRITRVTILCLSAASSIAWVSSSAGYVKTTRSLLNMAGNLHGESACFLPLEQMESDYYAPRIVQVRLALFTFLNR